MNAVKEHGTQAADTTTWSVDAAHTTVGFSVKHLMISTVRGRFTDVDATIEGDPRRPLEARAEAVIEAASIDTGNADRDAHLRSADFFDVETYPTLRYQSRSVRSIGTDTFEVEGDLTIRDVTRPVTLDVTVKGVVRDPWGNQRVVLRAEGALRRSDFGLTWNMPLETGGVLVGDEVKLSAEVQAVMEAVAEAA